MQLTRAEAQARVERGESLDGVRIRGMARPTREEALRKALHEESLADMNLAGMYFRDADLSGTAFARSNFDGANLRHADMRWSDVRWARLRRADLRWSDIRWAHFSQSDLQWAVMHQAEAGRCSFERANLCHVDASSANFSGADFTRAYAIKADFTAADLTGVDFSEADLEGARFAEANLTGVNFTRVNLKGVDLPGLLNIGDILGERTLTWPTPSGWEVQFGDWINISTKVLRDMAAEAWPGERRSAELLEIAERFDAHAADHHKTQEWLRDYWGQRAAHRG